MVATMQLLKNNVINSSGLSNKQLVKKLISLYREAFQSKVSTQQKRANQLWKKLLAKPHIVILTNDIFYGFLGKNIDFSQVQQQKNLMILLAKHEQLRKCVLENKSTDSMEFIGDPLEIQVPLPVGDIKNYCDEGLKKLHAIFTPAIELPSTNISKYQAILLQLIPLFSKAMPCPEVATIKKCAEIWSYLVNDFSENDRFFQLLKTSDSLTILIDKLLGMLSRKNHEENDSQNLFTLITIMLMDKNFIHHADLSSIIHFIQNLSFANYIAFDQLCFALTREAKIWPQLQGLSIFRNNRYLAAQLELNKHAGNLHNYIFQQQAISDDIAYLIINQDKLWRQLDPWQYRSRVKQFLNKHFGLFKEEFQKQQGKLEKLNIIFADKFAGKCPLPPLNWQVPIIRPLIKDVTSVTSPSPLSLTSQNSSFAMITSKCLSQSPAPDARNSTSQNTTPLVEIEGRLPWETPPTPKSPVEVITYSTPRIQNASVNNLCSPTNPALGIHSAKSQISAHSTPRFSPLIGVQGSARKLDFSSAEENQDVLNSSSTSNAPSTPIISINSDTIASLPTTPTIHFD